MFKFLFGRRGSPEPVKETQRETVERALAEVNEILAELDPKPKVTLDPETGEIALALPEQMPDEALALPAPDTGTSEPGDEAEPGAPAETEAPKAAA